MERPDPVMTNAEFAEPTARGRRRELIINAVSWGLVLGVLALVLAPNYAAIETYLAAQGFHPHWPDLDFWFAQSAAIQTHVYAAVSAFLLGVLMLTRQKGDKLHKTIGWAWVAVMFVTAASSLLITEIRHGAYSFIHLISGWTLIALPMGIYAIRRGNVRTHRRAMVGIFIGGMLVAGALTFLPGRIMWRLFLG